MTGPTNNKISIVQASTALVGLLLLGGCSTFDKITDKSASAASFMFQGSNGSDFSSRVYAGVSAGTSRLSPDTDGTRFTLGDREGGSTQLRIGADINSKLSLELESSVLGSAAVQEVEADVAYSSIAASAMFYALGSDANRSRRMGWQGYGRLGYASLQRASIVQPFDGTDNNLVLGLGVEYGFRNGLGFRGEVTRFDEDAMFFGLGVVYRLGVSARQFSTVVANVAKDAIPGITSSSGEPALAAANPEESAAPGHVSLVHEGPNASLWSQPKLPNDADGDGVLDGADNCNHTVGNAAVGQNGCGLFDSVLSDVKFKPGTYWLTPSSRRVIDEVVSTLLAFPEARIEVQAHADSEGPEEVNKIISTARAKAVVDYMIEHGVGRKQLVAKGYGESQPVASNDTAEGRNQNRRVQLVTLPSLTPAEIESQNPTNSSAKAVKAGKAKKTPAIEVTLKPEELNELASVAKNLSGTSAKMSLKTSGDEADTVEPVAAAALPAKNAVENDYAPAVRVPSLGFGGPLPGVKFKPGTTEFENSAEQNLSIVAKQLNATKDIRVAFLVHVNENSDKASNLALSHNQAEALVDYVVTLGVERDRLVAEPYGDTLPLSQTVDENDRNRNRRIEMRVINPPSQ